MSDQITIPSQDVKIRSVISILIFPPESSSHLLLFRRSSQVRTYQQKLAPIAGSIEESDPSPTAAAWRELHEETQLGQAEIELWRRGIGFEFTDDAVKRKWKVWPFAFRFRPGIDEKKINIDWEHEGYEWRTVEDILTGRIQDDCVPRLETTLSQLWIDPGCPLSKVLNDLGSDHEHGARQLATKAVEGLVSVVDESTDIQDVEKWWKEIRIQAFHLAVNARPSMSAAISSAIVSALENLKKMLSQPTKTSEIKAKAIKVLQQCVKDRNSITIRLSEHFFRYLEAMQSTNTDDHSNKENLSPIKIMTFSSSSTIKSTLLHALSSDPNIHIDLYILESRPLYEGVSLAKSLVSEAQKHNSTSSSSSFTSRLKITLATDSSVSLLTNQGLDLVILGADRISASGDVSNKIGSLPAVLAAKYVLDATKRPKVMVVSESEKIVSPDSHQEHQIEENDEQEVINDWNLDFNSDLRLWKDMVHVRNVYFEWIPAEYIDVYLCEEGVWGKNQIQKKAEMIDTSFNAVLGPEIG